MNSTTTQTTDPGARWQWKRWHWGILLLGLIFRFVSAWWISKGDAYCGWDGREYHAFAQSLAVLGGDEYPRFFNFVRAPGYPVLLIPFVWIGGTAIWPVQLVQCFLGVFQVWLLAEIVRRWAGRRAGDWMLVIAACHPFLIYYNGFILTETAFMALLWVAVLLLQRLVIGSHRDVWRSVVWSGLALGMASLVRPATQPLLPIAVIWLGIQAWRTGGFQACWRQMGVFTAMASAILLPWQVGNLVVHHEFTLGPNYGKAVYLQSNSYEFLKMYEAKTSQEYYRAFTDSVYSLSVTNGTTPESWMIEAKRFQAEHRDAWWRMQVFKVLHFWRPWLNSVIFPKPIYLVSILATTPFFIIAAMEFWRRRKQWDPFLSLLSCMVISGFVIGGLLFVASVRYRIPLVDVTFLILSASWLSWKFPGKAGRPPA